MLLKCKYFYRFNNYKSQFGIFPGISKISVKQKKKVLFPEMSQDFLGRVGRPIFDQPDARRHSVSWTLIGQKLFHYAMYLLPLNLVSKNQLSTNQNLFNAHAISRMYHAVGHASSCIVCCMPGMGRDFVLGYPTPYYPRVPVTILFWTCVQ